MVTVQRIHFEDFGGEAFERLVFAYLVRTSKWRTIEWYGQSGSDKGRDIWGVRESSKGSPPESVCALCANWRQLTVKKAKGDIDKMIAGTKGRPDRVIIVAGGKVSSHLRDEAKKHAVSKGIPSADVWSGPDFEEFLRRDTESLLKRFTAGEAFPDSPGKLAAFAEADRHAAKRCITELLAQQVQGKLSAEKRTRKYIPELFVETSSVKDRARIFCHPALFLRLVEDNLRQLNLLGLNRGLKKVGLLPAILDLPSRRVASGKLDDLCANAETLRKAVNSVTESLSRFTQDGVLAFRSSVPDDKLETFDLTNFWIFQGAEHLRSLDAKEVCEELDTALARVFVVVSRAGQGKTNFVCDLAERFLLPRGIPCALVSGSDLRGVAVERLFSQVARILSSSSCDDLAKVLAEIEEAAIERRSLGILIFDALNEHDNIAAFAPELERLVEKCLLYPHLRIILTCRSEYYESRFKNLENSSFGARMVLEREIHWQMDKRHKEHLLAGYFRFFKIPRSYVSAEVLQRLTEDVFMLRMFCEAYGDPDARKPVSIPFVESLRKDVLFERYLQRKFSSLATRSRTPGVVGSKQPYKDLLSKIVMWMVDHRQFSAVPSDIFNPSELAVLTELIDEDFFLRRDLREAASALNRLDEVVNFTFDEFRDFLIADYSLSQAQTSDGERFRLLLSLLTTPKTTVSEGIAQYLFFLSRRPGRNSVLKVIETQPWYDWIFLFNVFDLIDGSVTDDDLSRLRRVCSSLPDGPPAAVVVNLLRRYDTVKRSKLNILLLFDVLDALSDEQFNRAVRKTFGRSEFRSSGGYYPVSRFAENVYALLSSSAGSWSDEYAHLARFLLYLWDVMDADYNYPARELFKYFERARPDLARATAEEHLKRKSKGYAGGVNRSMEFRIRSSDPVERETGGKSCNYGKQRKLVLRKTTMGVLVTYRKKPTLSACMRAVGARPASYAGVIVRRAFEWFVDSVLDLKKQYHDYYGPEYKDVGAFLYHKYGCSMLTLKAVKPDIDPRHFLGLAKNSMRPGGEIQGFIDYEGNDETAAGILGATWEVVE